MMNSNPLEVAKLISRKYTPRQREMTLRDKQILVSCAGTVGNVRLIGSDLDGIIGSQDIIRIISDEEKVPFGFIYAYLTSPTAYNYIQSYIYGSVVPRIEPITLSSLPVPCFSNELVNECNQLIKLSLSFREKAIILLKKSVKSLEQNLPEFKKEKVYSLNICDISNYRKRLESSLQINSFKCFYTTLDKSGIRTEAISKLSNEVFTPNIFKRIKVEKSKSSVPYIGGAELLNFRPKIDSFLSKNTKKIEDYILKRGYIAIQDSGSIQSMGYVSLIPNFLEGVAATNNLVRVVPKSDINYNYYIFTFLKTKQANYMMKKLAYGTGQLHIDNSIISNFQVPIFDDLIPLINKNIAQYLELLENAHKAESSAINLIEKEIESWQE